MFKSVTWGQYIGFLLLALTVYYVYVAARYYRVEILALFKGTGRGGVASAPVVDAAARPSLVGSSGVLISSAALATQSPADNEDEDAEEEEKGEEKEDESEGKIADAEGKEAAVEEVKIQEPNTDNFNNHDHKEDADALPGPEAADSEVDFTVGVAQLSDYFEDAAEGNMTQEELVGHMPELDNTALLVAFFQSNTKAAQQLTSQYYVDVPEPVLD
jgi:hypothetical protein